MMTAPMTSPPRAPALQMTPGRWVALAIGAPIVLVLIAWSAFSLVSGIGRASFPVSTSIPLQHGHLVVSTGGGDVTVHQDQGRSANAQLTGTVQYSLIRPRLTIDRDGLHLACRLPTGNCALNATIDVPLDTAVNLASGGGNMQVNGIGRDVTLNSGGGNVAVSGVGGIADVTTGGGNLTASDLAHTLKFSTDGGDVNGNGLTSQHVTTESGGGNVALVFTSVPADLKVISDGGDISVVLPHGSTTYTISYTTDGGNYSAPVPIGPSSGHTITVESGGGNVSITEAS
jgi:hypothetical protein